MRCSPRESRTGDWNHTPACFWSSSLLKCPFLWLFHLTPPCLDTKKRLVASAGGMCGQGYKKCVHLSVSACLGMLLENSRGQSVHLPWPLKNMLGEVHGGSWPASCMQLPLAE